MKPSGVTSTMDIAIETDPVAAVTFATYIKKFTTINASYPEPLFDVSGGEAFVNSIEDISGDIVTLPLEETPENFVKGFSFSPRTSLNSSTEYFNRCQGYEKEYKQLSEEEKARLWKAKLDELQSMKKKQELIKESVMNAREEGEQLPPEYTWNGLLPELYSSAELDTIGWKIKTDTESDSFKRNTIRQFNSSFDTKTSWLCEGCKKSFTTKASLQRHIERKAGCKTKIEKKADDPFLAILNENENESLVDWVERIMKKSISGDAEYSLCKGCEIEFANKSNLLKHMTKSPSCNKLAKINFLKLIYDQIDKKKIADCDVNSCNLM